MEIKNLSPIIKHGILNIWRHKMLSKLRQKRLLSNIILDDVKLATNIDQGRLSRIERGKADATEEEKRTLADFFNCKVEDIF